MLHVALQCRGIEGPDIFSDLCFTFVVVSAFVAIKENGLA